MKIQLEESGYKLVADLGSGTSIAIDLDFDGKQPNHFGVKSASCEAVVVGDFVGDTNRGGGCNVDALQLIPHCNGTHTETVGHIVNESVPVAQIAKQAFFLAELVTVRPVRDAGGDSYVPELQDSDVVITAAELAMATESLRDEVVNALVVRTLPNDVGKLSRVYGKDAEPAFFSTQAMQLVADMKIDHLLVDLPSVDRMSDDGLLSNHHLYWDVKQGEHELNSNTFIDKTITEMIFVPESLPDGTYLLNLQIAPFCCDAAPSRPILFPVSVKN